MGYQEFKLELPQVPRLRLKVFQTCHNKYNKIHQYNHNFQTKVLFFLHFLLISWATLGRWAELVSVSVACVVVGIGGVVVVDDDDAFIVFCFLFFLVIPKISHVP